MTIITDERSGEVPADLSAEASEARSKRMRTADCNGTDVPEAWKNESQATLDEKLDRIATIQGEDAKFATSLVEQYAKRGELSTKQVTWVARLYRKHADLNHWRRLSLLQHNWKLVGSVTHYANNRLGTFSATDYYECTKCSELGEEHHFNNYSGD